MLAQRDIAYPTVQAYFMIEEYNALDKANFVVQIILVW